MEYAIKARVCPTCSKTQPVSDGSICTRCGDPMDAPTMADFANNLLRGFGAAQTGVPVPDTKPQKQLIFPPLEMRKAV